MKTSDIIKTSDVQYMFLQYSCCFISGVNKEKKALFEWVFDRVASFDSPMLVRTWRGKTTMISIDDLQTFNGNIPDMSLRSTAEFFVNRLSANDKKKLAQTMKSLHGKTIRVGTTCSGTDVIIPVLNCTFDTLSRLFNATW